MIQTNEVKKLAELARIEMAQQEVDELARDIEAILAYVSELQSVNIDTSVSSAPEHRNVTRSDEEPHESGTYSDMLLAGTPRQERGYVQVKKIL